MAVCADGGVVTDGDEAGTNGELSGVLGAIRRCIRWLGDLHRGYAYTGHLPRRER